MMKELHIQISHDFYITFDLPESNFGQFWEEKKSKYHLKNTFPPPFWTTCYTLHKSFLNLISISKRPLENINIK